MREHCVGATGPGLGPLSVYTHVRIYAFSIYLIYAADVMPGLSMGRETKGGYEEYLATALNSTSIFSLAAARERETMRIAFCGRLRSDSVLEMSEGIMPR